MFHPLSGRQFPLHVPSLVAGRELESVIVSRRSSHLLPSTKAWFHPKHPSIHGLRLRGRPQSVLPTVSSPHQFSFLVRSSPCPFVFLEHKGSRSSLRRPEPFSARPVWPCRLTGL